MIAFNRFCLHVGFAVAASIAASACSHTPQEAATEKPSMKDVVFLTRKGCVNTAAMRTRLDEALQEMALPVDYQFIDADTLQSSDPRGGYGTPTVLYKGVDLFGMEQPPVPHPPPT